MQDDHLKVYSEAHDSPNLLIDNEDRNSKLQDS